MNMNPSPEIVFQNSDFLAVVKPFGMIVNNADTSAKLYTLQDWVDENVGYEKKNPKNSEYLDRSGIVHRLDKETSGVILIAKNEEAFLNIQNEFKQRRVEKTYTALCHGEILSSGSVSMPIGRLPWNRMRFGIVPDGRTALTEFKPVAYYKDPSSTNKTLTLLDVFPKTGRTHQIRVHMQYLGYPIYSDSLYAGRKVALNDRKKLSRHFLHAKELSFEYFGTGERLTISSKLPHDLQEFLETLKKK